MNRSSLKPLQGANRSLRNRKTKLKPLIQQIPMPIPLRRDWEQQEEVEPEPNWGDRWVAWCCYWRYGKQYHSRGC